MFSESQELWSYLHDLYNSGKKSEIRFQLQPVFVFSVFLGREKKESVSVYKKRRNLNPRKKVSVENIYPFLIFKG